MVGIVTIAQNGGVIFEYIQNLVAAPKMGY
jgi:hypothetical protein